MQLIFERGARNAPVGHALIYFRADDGTILATSVNVPPIAFDIASFVPPAFAEAMRGLDLSQGMVATPMPPIPEEVPGMEWLQALAARRHDDLVFAGGVMRGNPTQLMAETAEAAREYAELYNASSMEEAPVAPQQPVNVETNRFMEMSERERLDELTRMTGRLRDAVERGLQDAEVELQMRGLAGLLPPKYRVFDLIEAALIPGERGRRLAELYLERSYKLYHEEYLDLERIDREIAALRDES